MGNYKKLAVYEKSVDLAVLIYEITKVGEFAIDYGLKDQCRRAAVSISSNIAEGECLDTNKQAIKHFYYSRGSAAELLTQMLIARKVGYISDSVFLQVEKNCSLISAMLKNLINRKIES